MKRRLAFGCLLIVTACSAKQLALDANRLDQNGNANQTARAATVKGQLTAPVCRDWSANGVRFINKQVRGKAMTIKRRFVILLAAMMAFGCAPASAAPRRDCLLYEPASVKLTGETFRKVFPGRPNYESIKKGDEPEQAWLLRLAKPICVRGDDNNEAEAQVSLIHLVLRGKQFSQLRRLRRKGAVTFTGTLFHAITGHHHAKVLMWVLSMK